MNADLKHAIRESIRESRVVDVHVEDVVAAEMDLLASEYETDSSSATDGRGRPCMEVWGWVENVHAGANTDEWKLRIYFD